MCLFLSLFSLCVSLWHILLSLLHYLLCNEQQSIHSGLKNSAVAGFCGLVGLGQTILLHMTMAGSFLWLGSVPGLEVQERITSQNSSGWRCSLPSMYEPWVSSLVLYKQDVVAHVAQLSNQQAKTGRNSWLAWVRDPV